MHGEALSMYNLRILVYLSASKSLHHAEIIKGKGNYVVVVVTISGVIHWPYRFIVSLPVYLSLLQTQPAFNCRSNNSILSFGFIGKQEIPREHFIEHHCES